MICNRCKKQIKTKKCYKVTTIDYITIEEYFCCKFCMNEYYGWNEFIIERVITK